MEKKLTSGSVLKNILVFKKADNSEL